MIRELDAVPAQNKSCGTCSMCCKLFEVSWLEKPKPAGRWCHHCRPGRGCAIWETRPDGCRNYFCVWRIDPDLAPEWRPDTAKFLLTQMGVGFPLMVVVDPATPSAHRRPPYDQVLRKMTRELLETRGSAIVVVVAERRFVMLPDQDVAIPDGLPLTHVQILRVEDATGEHFDVEFRLDT